MSGLSRQYIPAALHSELTEYSSLLRALRTNSILDVSLQLAQHGIADSSTSDDSDNEAPLASASSAPIESSTGGKRKRTDQKAPPRKRDKWTRWPLLLTDLHKPTWCFEDEIAIVTSEALKLFPPAFQEPNSERNSPKPSEPMMSEEYNGDRDEGYIDVDESDRPSYFNFIAISASTLLLNVLLLLSSHTPPRPPSMQNRIEPLDWRSVLEIISVYGNPNIVDGRLIDKVRARMEVLYGLAPGSSYPETEEGEDLDTFRMRKRAEAKKHLQSRMSQAHDSLFTLTEPTSDFFTASLRKQRRNLRRKKLVASDDSSEPDEQPLTVMVRELNRDRRRAVQSEKAIN
ncbi:hypothetical protein APHAL10511_007261 [Amanita phalloides]|nr:hypothetical protein APHAL10511_007261 [Amanita phalloides]